MRQFSSSDFDYAFADYEQQRKALSRAEKELEEYRQQLRDFAEKVKRRHTDEVMKEEMDRLRALAEESQTLAQSREEEIDELKRRLEMAEQGTDDFIAFPTPSKLRSPNAIS